MKTSASGPRTVVACTARLGLSWVPLGRLTSKGRLIFKHQPTCSLPFLEADDYSETRTRTKKTDCLGVSLKKPKLEKHGEINSSKASFIIQNLSKPFGHKHLQQSVPPKETIGSFPLYGSGREYGDAKRLAELATLGGHRSSAGCGTEGEVDRALGLGFVCAQWKMDQVHGFLRIFFCWHSTSSTGGFGGC